MIDTLHIAAQACLAGGGIFGVIDQIALRRLEKTGPCRYSYRREEAKNLELGPFGLLLSAGISDKAVNSWPSNCFARSSLARLTGTSKRRLHRDFTPRRSPTLALALAWLDPPFF